MLLVSSDQAVRFPLVTPTCTARLRLETIGPSRVDDLWLLHQDPGIAAWYAGTWSRDEAGRRAAGFARSWETDGIGKWLAYDRVTNELVGRGGASKTIVAGEERVEVGWAVRRVLWGRGYATEIGEAGIRLADEVLRPEEIVAYTEVHNRRSRSVMKRLGMTFVGEIREPGLVKGRAGLHDDAPFALYALQLRGRVHK
jgi:RimJ/RimL family protein N-acetyltransferase